MRILLSLVAILTVLYVATLTVQAPRVEKTTVETSATTEPAPEPQK